VILKQYTGQFKRGFSPSFLISFTLSFEGEIEKESLRGAKPLFLISS